MNKGAFLIVLALTSGLVLTGCNKKGKLSQPSTEKAPPTGPVMLVLKWPAGESIVKRIDMKMDSVINVPNMPNPIKQNSTIGQKYGLTVAKGPQATGGPEVDMDFLSVNMTVEQAGKTLINYDSAAKPTDAPKDEANTAVAKMFKDIVGFKLKYFLNATNGIDHVEGLDALNGKLNGGPAGASGMKSLFNEATLQQMLGDTRGLPPQPVQPNDTWPLQMEMSMGEMGTLIISNSFTFSQWEKHGPRLCARLDYDGTLKGKPADQPNPTGMTITVQSGTISGTLWFDPELGTVIDSSADQDLTIAMEVPTQMNGKMKRQSMSMQMHQLVSVKLDSVK